MIEIRSILIPALTTALTTATGLKVYDGLPIELAGTAVYPHINISDINVQEDGPKNGYFYRVNILLEIVHKGRSTMQTLYNDMNKILSIVNNAIPFELESPYKIINCTLETSTTTKATIEKQLIDIGIIRLLFNVE